MSSLGFLEIEIVTAANELLLCKIKLAVDPFFLALFSFPCNLFYARFVCPLLFLSAKFVIGISTRSTSAGINSFEKTFFFANLGVFLLLVSKDSDTCTSTCSTFSSLTAPPFISYSHLPLD